MRKCSAFFCMLIIFFSACYYDGAEIVFDVPPPDKTPPGSINILRAALYIDTAQESYEDVQTILESVARYTILPQRNITGEAVQFFDYIILSGGIIKQGSVSAILELSDELLRILRNTGLLRPLRARGIKILLGITGGNDGISFGSLPGEGMIKNRETYAQIAFARQVYDFCDYYLLSGVEFYDVFGESADRNPYPVIGEYFHNGEQDVYVLDQQDYDLFWRAGGGNFVDMLSHILEFFGADASHQGDIPFDQRIRSPILIREARFGARIPDAVPRYEFASSLACITYLVNNSRTVFGWEGSGDPNVPMGWVGSRNYAPVIFDLTAVTPAQLDDFSVKLGRRRDNDGNHVIAGQSEYGLIYFENFDPDPAKLEDQRQILSVISNEVFGAPVQLN